MTLDEAMQDGVIVSRAEAIAEVQAHSISTDEFLTEVGDRTEYTSREVLEWLGY